MQNGTRIYLIGMMGSGKSHWARILTEKTALPWLDLDEAIEQQTHLSVTQLFEQFGEPYFREKETACLHQTALNNKLIVATGGGAPCFFDNMAWMNKHGITIWLNEPVQILTKRAMQQVAHRPAIQGLSEKEVFDLFNTRFNDRKPFYSQAQHTLQGNNITLPNLLKIVATHAQGIH